jgi:hypothetical protein
MNLYKISQDANSGYDTFDSAVVCAENEEIARNMDPAGSPDEDLPNLMDWHNHPGCLWCESPDLVKVELIGSAAPKLPQGVICASFGVICASFNAG